jgi:ketosteroid isomerase-like protein
MKTVILLTLFALVEFSCAPDKLEDAKADEKAIREVTAKQVIAWNKGDIDGFMKGYWNSDSILFIGSRVTQGWANTLARYKKSYPDKAAMGTLEFALMRMDNISKDAWLVTGRYTLTREKDTPTGIFTLLFERKHGEWLIVYDHTGG